MKTEIPVYRGSVRIGLHYIKGNKAPYFSVTSCNGADHDAILRNYPELFDVVALHLSYIDGTPIYAVENGEHFIKSGELATIADHFRISMSAAECLRRVCYSTESNQTRTDTLITMAESAGLVGYQAMFAAEKASRKTRDQIIHDVITDFVERRKPIWKAEADACIKRHNLKVYGDPWPHDIDSF